MEADLARARRRLAALNGVQPSFVDAAGERQSASPEVLCALLHALGVPAGNEMEVRESLRAGRLRPYRQGIEPATVAWDGHCPKVSVQLPAKLAHKLTQARVLFEAGHAEKLKPCLVVLKTREIEGEHFEERQISLPPLPFGYHTLEITAGDALYRTLVISSPIHSYTEPCDHSLSRLAHSGSKPPGGRPSPSPPRSGGEGWDEEAPRAHGEKFLDPASRRSAAETDRPSTLRSWGAFLPMYAVHSEQSWGAGNFSDWERFSNWIGELGGSVAATLPLLAAFLDYPDCEPSPYSPASRLFWNEFYLDITRVPEFAHCRSAQSLVRSKSFQSRLRAFRASDIIDYRAQWQSRRQVLELLAKDFFSRSSRRRINFQNYLQQHPQVEDYAAFRAVCDKLKKSWQHWPERMRNGTLRQGDYDESTNKFHLYVQWLAQEQVEQLAAHGERAGVKLYLDLPLGVSPNGYDVWRERDSFALGADAGAPPDMFFTKGQNWGFAPLHPRRIRESGYRHVLALLRFQMRHARMLRIDHVMGLHRLYWVPRGFAAREGTYVHYPAEELQAIFNLESHRHRTILVGENLGTVPPIVNRSLRWHRLREMFVVQFEEQPDPNAALRRPPTRSVASLNTHDTPTFAAHWRGDDLVDRVRLGLLSKAELKGAKKQRDRLKKALVNFLAKHGFSNSPQAQFQPNAGATSPSPPRSGGEGWGEVALRAQGGNRLVHGKVKPQAHEVLRALLAWLRASPSELVLVNVEDLWLERRPQNVPGTSNERPNWRRKTRFTLEEIFQNHELHKLLSF